MGGMLGVDGACVYKKGNENYHILSKLTVSVFNLMSHLRVTTPTRVFLQAYVKFCFAKTCMKFSLSSKYSNF